MNWNIRAFAGTAATSFLARLAQEPRIIKSPVLNLKSLTNDKS